MDEAGSPGSLREPRAAALTPDVLTQLHQTIWTERGNRVGLDVTVPPCPYTVDELAALDGAGRRVGYLPPEVATRSTRHVLGAMFPAMDCYSLQPDNEVENIVSRPGWFDYEAAIDAPYGDTTEAELLQRVAADGRELISLNQYIVAAQDSRLFTGHYLDERRTWPRIGIRVTGRIVCVRFDGDEMAEGLGDEPPQPGALLTAYDLHHDFRAPYTGGRSFGVARSERARTLPAEPPAPARGVHVSQRGAVDLDAEWRRQVDRLVAAGVAAELGLTPESYAASLPRFTPQPATYAGRLDAPVLVETRIGWRRQFELFGIRVSPILAVFPAPVPTGPDSAHRDAPYAAWFTRWGQRFDDPTSPDEARADLRADEVGANLVEGGAVAHAFPELVEAARFFDFVGEVLPAGETDGPLSFEPIDRTPGICRWRGVPEFGCNLYPLAFSVFRPLVRGREITTT
ncbi:hypothetical protein ACFQ34_03380 [Pseudonocardia benzenivorans]|uniref:Uncharacterized protein n=2 Tax=Pseudonocardia TaxID=1847 RepID=F4CS42_PSEUX|nr:hypothetical protein [Pseudonocardia dioxanivorans]AEA28486.1 hypothetical protein Psed_6390 [Pseudonocardia dioxanivorans CB1190]GJF01950.1 hypothetical protein PSD17_09140 [Pseudonocardia sp. D17]